MIMQLMHRVATQRTTGSTIRMVAIVVILMCAECSKETVNPDQELHDALQTMKVADGDKAAIQSFAKKAAAADIPALVQTFDPAVRKTADPAQMREYLVTKVVPFFKDFRKVDTYEAIAPASFPDGRVGTVHYTYIEDNAGRKKPISIALIAEGGTVGVVNVTVGQCVKDRHPVSAGRCDS